MLCISPKWLEKGDRGGHSPKRAKAQQKKKQEDEEEEEENEYDKNNSTMLFHTWFFHFIRRFETVLPQTVDT